VIGKSGISENELDYILSGDLLNQCVGSAFAIKGSNAPFFGLYGACSTMAESLSLAAMLVDGGYANQVCALTSSHFCSAERQFRLPLAYGGQRTP
ncbi:MAG: stage V sporulation protein AD, partial [Oscillospiraceae bacterium]